MSSNRTGAIALAVTIMLAAAGANALAQGPAAPHHQGHGGPGPQAPAAGPQQPGGMAMSPQQMQEMHQRMMQGGQMGQAQPAPQAPGTQGQDPHHPGASAAAAQSPAVAAFLAINERMHREMAVEFTGNVDRDFAAAMIPHHQGAIDMARVVLDQGGRDPEIRGLAEAVVRTQQEEIARLRAFLARQH